VGRKIVIKKTRKMNHQENDHTVLRYYALDSLVFRVIGALLQAREVKFALCAQKHLRGGWDGEKESTAKTKKPSKHTAASSDIESESLIGMS
jgi:hypothetical protein